MKTVFSSLLVFCAAHVLFSQELLNFTDFSNNFQNNSNSQIELLPDGGFVHCDAISFMVDIDPGVDEWLINEEGESGFVLTRFSESGSVVWSHFIQAQIPISIFGLVITSNDELIISGNFSGAVDFDPGPGENTRATNVVFDVFVASYDLNGELNWAVSASGSENDSYSFVRGLTVDLEGNIILTGGFNGMTDFDPGETEFMLSNSSDNGDCFLYKLNSAGEFIFAIGFDSVTTCEGLQVSTDLSSNIILRGTLTQDMDLDPGFGTFLLDNGNEYTSEFLAKYTSSGDFEWAFLLPNHVYDASGTCLLLTDNYSNIIIGAYLYGTEGAFFDYDPGPGEAFTNTTFGWVIVKYSPDGELIWFRSGADGTISEMILSADGYIYTSGLALNDADLDGGIGEFSLVGDFTTPIYFAKYDLNGDFIWGFGLGGEDFEVYSTTTDMEIDQTGNIVIAGTYSDDLDIDPGDNEVLLEAIPNYSPLFFASYSQGICGNTGMIMTEAENLSCDDYTATLSAAFVSGAEPFSYQWNTGDSTSSIEAQGIGTYTVYGMDGNGCELERHVIVSGPTTPDNFDLNPNAMAWNFIPGFDTYIQLDASNDGCGYVTTGALILTIDQDLTLLNVSPPADNINGNVITWNFADLNYDSVHLTPSVSVNTPVQTPLGEIMNISVEMTPSAGDYNADNNIKNYEYEVVGSYDPNIIEVYPKGTGEEGYINANETMTYTIHFQNTGTAPAVNIDVLDVIDTDLNINTVQVIGSSHAMHTEVENGNTLRFVFDNIMLADSTSNEPESHGYVIYTIQQQPNLPFYTQMENTAAIYFDFNAPVITNTVINTIEGPNFVEESAQGNVLQLYPNPASTSITLQCGNSRDNLIQIVSMDGRQVASFRSLQNQLVYDVSELANGLYEVRLTDENGNIRSNRFIKK